MPTYIKTGYWDTKAKAPDGWLDLNLFCATHGGGGGSQNLDQVLAVGDTATNKGITLNGTNNCVINLIRNGVAGQGLSPFGNYLAINSGSYQGSINSNFVPTNNNVVHSVTSYPSGLSTTQMSQFIYEANINGKNVFFIKKINGSVNNSRRFVVNASYTEGNSVVLEDNNTNADTSARVEVYAEDNTVLIALTSTQILSLNVFEQLLLRPSELQFINTNGNVIQIFPSFSASGTIAVNFPEYDGKIANVNERIVATNIDLSAGSFDCDRYGVYQVEIGDNSRVFDLTNFVNNGVDGQFVTICVKDTPVTCFNGQGSIHGTAIINSNGLYKLMKIGNDIYSSNI